MLKHDKCFCKPVFSMNQRSLRQHTPFVKFCDFRFLNAAPMYSLRDKSVCWAIHIKAAVFGMSGQWDMFDKTFGFWYGFDQLVSSALASAHVWSFEKTMFVFAKVGTVPLCFLTQVFYWLCGWAQCSQHTCHLQTPYDCSTAELVPFPCCFPGWTAF